MKTKSEKVRAPREAALTIQKRIQKCGLRKGFGYDKVANKCRRLDPLQKRVDSLEKRIARGNERLNQWRRMGVKIPAGFKLTI